MRCRCCCALAHMGHSAAIPAWFCVPNDDDYQSEQLHSLKGVFALC